MARPYEKINDVTLHLKHNNKNKPRIMAIPLALAAEHTNNNIYKLADVINT